MEVVFSNGKVFLLSGRNQYVTQYYIFYLNSNVPLNVDLFLALYAFVSVVKWVFPAVPVQLWIATHSQIPASNGTVWLWKEII